MVKTYTEEVHAQVKVWRQRASECDRIAEEHERLAHQERMEAATLRDLADRWDETLQASDAR